MMEAPTYSPHHRRPPSLDALAEVCLEPEFSPIPAPIRHHFPTSQPTISDSHPSLPFETPFILTRFSVRLV